MYKVAIRENATGEIRLCEQDLEWQDHSDFWWTEGNMACDCNRSVEFAEAGGEGEEIESAVDIPCTDGLYTALYAELEDGTKVELES